MEAWLDLLMMARFDKEPVEILLGNEIVICGRGQIVRSINTYQKRWNWGAQRVKSFFEILLKLKQIEKKTTNKTTIITICNYDSYQGDQQTDIKPIINGKQTDIKPITTKKQGKTMSKEGLNNENNKDTYLEIQNIFNSVCINLPKIQKLTSARKKIINARTKEYDLLTIGEVFNKVAESNFLNGENENGWTASFDWIFKASNFVKILEDNYKNKSNGNKTQKERAGELFDEIRKQHPDL